MSITTPIVVEGEVVRVFSYNRVALRLAIWPGVEVSVEARLEGLDPANGMSIRDHDAARQCAIILMGGKKVVAHLDRRATNPITRLYRAVRHDIPGHMATGVADGYASLLFINSFLQSLAPDFNTERVTKQLNH